MSLLQQIDQQAAGQIGLHFYLAHLHPFVDGNGRTARALLLPLPAAQGYWLAEYISISRLLRRAPAQYGRAFLHTETDGADFTYFLLHQLRILYRSINELWRTWTPRPQRFGTPRGGYAASRGSTIARSLC